MVWVIIRRRGYPQNAGVLVLGCIQREISPNLADPHPGLWGYRFTSLSNIICAESPQRRPHICHEVWGYHHCKIQPWIFSQFQKKITNLGGKLCTRFEVPLKSFLYIHFDILVKQKVLHQPLINTLLHIYLRQHWFSSLTEAEWHTYASVN